MLALCGGAGALEMLMISTSLHAFALTPSFGQAHVLLIEKMSIFSKNISTDSDCCKVACTSMPISAINCAVNCAMNSAINSAINSAYLQ